MRNEPLSEQSDAEAEEKRAGLRPWRMGAVGCMAAKAPGRARRKGSNGRDGLASCMATTRRKRKPHGQRRVAQCESFNGSCGKQSRSDVIPDRESVEVPIAPAAAMAARIILFLSGIASMGLTMAVGGFR